MEFLPVGVIAPPSLLDSEPFPKGNQDIVHMFALDAPSVII